MKKNIAGLLVVIALLFCSAPIANAQTVQEQIASLQAQLNILIKMLNQLLAQKALDTTSTAPVAQNQASIISLSTNNAPTSLPISVVSPNSGTYQIGSPIKITWTGGPFDAGVSISLSGYAANTGVGYIGQVVNGDNYFMWDGKTYCNSFNNGVGSNCGTVKSGVHRVMLAGNNKSGKYSLAEGGNLTFTDASFVATTQTPNPITSNSNNLCPQSVVSDGVTYTLTPCNINMSMTDGQGDKTFSTTIVTNGASSNIYAFQVHGNGISSSLPIGGITTAGAYSGGGRGNQALDFKFNDSALSANGSKSQVYTGYLPIDVNGQYMYLNLNLTVNPS